MRHTGADAADIGHTRPFLHPTTDIERAAFGERVVRAKAGVVGQAVGAIALEVAADAGLERDRTAEVPCCAQRGRRRCVGLGFCL